MYAIGAKFAHPERAVFALVGDGRVAGPGGEPNARALQRDPALRLRA
jgi:hypothetical protein